LAKDITPARLRAFFRDIQKPAGEFGCWEWVGAKNGDGYASGGGNNPAYRMAYEWMVGPIPAGMELDHLCRNRICVNPHHLEPVTRAENQKRKREHGPREFRPYCRAGHPLVRGNARLWSGGPERGYRIYCRLCHDGERKEVRRGRAIGDARRFTRGAA
jgi:hypothetical protein